MKLFVAKAKVDRGLGIKFQSRVYLGCRGVDGIGLHENGSGLTLSRKARQGPENTDSFASLRLGVRRPSVILISTWFAPRCESQKALKNPFNTGTFT